MNQHKDNILRIPYGNDFQIYACAADIVPGSPDASFDNVNGLVAFITSHPHVRTKVEYQTAGPDIIFKIPMKAQRKTVFGLELVGFYNNHPWRWKAKDAFQIVDPNTEASDNGNETFGVETYYLYDILWVDTEGDTMIFTSHGHATIENGVLTVQETENTKATLEDDTIIFITKDK